MSKERPTYFLCGKKDVPRLVEKAKAEAAQILKEFEGFYNTNGKLGIEIVPSKCFRGYSIGGRLTWDGKTMSEEIDCSVIFLELNNLMLNRMIELGIPSFAGENEDAQ